MSDEAGDTAPAPPEAVVRVQAISDSKALERHLLRMFDQGQPLYTDYFDPDFAWKLWPDMVADRVDDWAFIYIESDGPDRTRIALALTFSMPTGTDPRINEAAVLAVASKAFAGHERVWVAGEHEGPFVKMLVEYRDEDGRAVPSGPADLRRYRDAYVGELDVRGVAARATTRGSRGLSFGEARRAYKGKQRLDDSSLRQSKDEFFVPIRSKTHQHIIDRRTYKCQRAPCLADSSPALIGTREIGRNAKSMG